MRVLVAVLVSVGFFILTFPVPRSSAFLGFSSLDVSWVWALNVAAASGWSFGRDILFTYGPLTYLLYPFDLGSHVTVSLLFRLALNLAAVLLVFRVLLVSAMWPVRAAFVGSTLLAAAINTELQLVAVVLLALTLSFAHPRPIAVGMLAAAAAALGLLVKFTLGVTTTAVVVVFCWLQWRERRMGWPGLVAVTGTGSTAAAILFLGIGGRPHDVGPFLRGSLELAGGYSTAMALEGPWVDIVLGLGVMAAVLVVGIWGRSQPVRRAAWMALPALFFAFKQGFVRQDVHHLVIFLSFLFSVAAALLAGLALTATPGRRDERLVFAVFAMAGTTLVVTGLAQPAEGPAALLEGEAGQALLRPVAFIQRPPFGRFACTARRNLEFARQFFALPQPVGNVVRGSTVDVVPWDAAYGAVNNFDWRPRPVFQSYAAYTPWLDGLNAAHFRSERAPRFVIYEPKPIDGHHPFFHEPRTWREILCRYELRTRSGPFFVLERHGRSGCREVPVGGGEVPLLAEIALPPEQRDLIVGLDIQVSPLGRLAAFAFRMPPVGLEVRYEDGTTEVHRVVTATAGGGLPLGYLPQNIGEVERFLRRTADRRVAAVRLLTNGAWAYRSTMRLSVLRLEPG